MSIFRTRARLEYLSRYRTRLRKALKIHYSGPVKNDISSVITADATFVKLKLGNLSHDFTELSTSRGGNYIDAYLALNVPGYEFYFKFYKYCTIVASKARIRTLGIVTINSYNIEDGPVFVVTLPQRSDETIVSPPSLAATQPYSQSSLIPGMNHAGSYCEHIHEMESVKMLANYSIFNKSFSFVKDGQPDSKHSYSWNLVGTTRDPLNQKWEGWIDFEITYSCIFHSRKIQEMSV